MRVLCGAALGAAALFSGLAGVKAADEELSACFDVVGTYLTTNTNPTSGRVVGRSLISLTNGGQVFLTDSNEGGDTGFAPFTEGHGAWRCTSDAGGRLRILATVLDFTHRTADIPEQSIARLDYDAMYDAATEMLTADVKLYFVPIDANPLDATALTAAVLNQIVGVRVTAQ